MQSATATLGPQALPALPRIPLSQATLDAIAVPVKRIQNDGDTHAWVQSTAHATYMLFVQRIAEASVGRQTSIPASPDHAPTPALSRLLALLFTLDQWTREIEPQRTPQRFGNLAFRDWGARLEAVSRPNQAKMNRVGSDHVSIQSVDELHRSLLPQSLHPFILELRAYLLDGFGSFVRIDYGSGHEFSFFAWLAYLYRLGFFDDGQTLAPAAAGAETQQPPTSVESYIGLSVFPLYLQVAWNLQDRYGLEPAGSHGVWGLDDFHFLSYLIGAAQLRSQSTLTPSALVKSGGSQTQGKDLYSASIARIHKLKRGPFHEHSPLLHDISTSVPNWIKVYTGMVKMYQAECINKRVVVQHFAFGGVGWVWTAAAASGTLAPAQRPPSLSQQSAGSGLGATLALGAEKGNGSSLGVPTARIQRPGTMMPPPPSPRTAAPWASSATPRPQGPLPLYPRQGPDRTQR